MLLSILAYAAPQDSHVQVFMKLRAFLRAALEVQLTPKWIWGAKSRNPPKFSSYCASRSMVNTRIDPS